MGTQPIKLRPGIDVEQTPVLNEAGFAASQMIRWRDGLPEKTGGWQHLNSTALTGTGRGMWAWADLLSNPYVAVGTEQRLQLFAFGSIYDITPLRATSNISPDFSTVSTSATVTVTDTANGAAAGDWINLILPVAIGGLILQGFYQVQTVIDANNYTITAASAATGTVNNGGAVPQFTTVNTSATVTVTLAAHGLAAGAFFSVQVATSVGGLTVTAAAYQISSPTTNTFTIAAGSTATSSTSAYENSGHARIEYLIPTGFPSATPISGYGIGNYGVGNYGGTSAETVLSPLRQWFLSNWGQDLLGNYTNSPLYAWVPPVADNNTAVQINTTNYPGALEPPTIVNVSFVAAPQQIAVCLGADAFGSGAIDPNLVRWSDVADFTDWEALTSNQAGSYRIPTGSRIVGGIQAGNFAYLWTDVDMWSMAYIGLPFVFGFSKIASGCDLLSARAVGIYESQLFWASNNNFFQYDGNQVQIIPCPVWDIFFYNLNRTQIQKVFTAVNSWFSEVTWYFPSAAGDGEVDSYVRYNIRENLWDYSVLTSNGYVRTCWIDDNVLGAPIGCDLNGMLQQHEVSSDADGAALTSSITTGYAALSEANELIFIERIMLDFILTGGTPPANTVFVSVLLIDYPTDTPTVLGPFAWQPTGPQYITIHARARMIGFQFSSLSLGVFWRLGNVRYIGAPAGRI